MNFALLTKALAVPENRGLSSLVMGVLGGRRRAYVDSVHILGHSPTQ